VTRPDFRNRVSTRFGDESREITQETRFLAPDAIALIHTQFRNRVSTRFGDESRKISAETRFLAPRCDRKLRALTRVKPGFYEIWRRVTGNIGRNRVSSLRCDRPQAPRYIDSSRLSPALEK
ncbi:MAG: hypothetical protein LH628_22560, partial [Microcoleus sp. CAN_BIN18]|nr:hypothetical protein [Microcoleus sp. CAN_BIN18]